MVPKTLVNSPIQVSFTYQIISHKRYPTFDFLGKHTKLFVHGNTTETLAGSPRWNRNSCVCVWGGVSLANPHTRTVPVPVVEFKRVWALVSTLSGHGEAYLPSTDGCFSWMLMLLLWREPHASPLMVTISGFAQYGYSVFFLFPSKNNLVS